MDIPIDQDQHWLIDCLKASMEPYKDRRSFAETSLHQAALQPGFGTALVRVAANREVNNDLRQLALVLLKQFVKQHWKVDDDGFIHPVASPTEKATIRQLLMLSMDDRIKRIRTVIAMVVTLIVNYDWPEEWPELLPHLLKLISDQTNVNGVHGGLKCLSIIAEDLDDKLVTKLVFVFFPYLHAIVSSPKLYDECLRVKAISIFHSCISILGSMTAVFKVETDEIMTSLLRSWTPQFLLILETPLHPKKPDGWDIKMVVLKCLMQLIQSFPTKAETEFVVVVASFWKTFTSCSNIYVLSSVQGDEDPYMACDSDGSDKNIEMFAVQLLELLQTAIQNSKLAQVIGSELDDLLYYVIAFLQMTEHQVYKWSHDVNEYVADEDDATYDCRVSGSFLLEGIVHVFGTKGINSLIKASVTHYKNSCESKLKGSIYWWQVHEACLFALSSIADSLLEEQSSGLNTEGLTTLLHQMLMEDKEIGHTYPFLHARAFVTVAKFSTMINDSLKEHFIYAAVQAISTNTPPPVKADACQALIHLLPESKPEFIQVHIIGLLSSLSDLLNQATEETLHLVLETLQAAVKAGREQSASIEPILSPIVLNKWVQVVSDPFISIDALDVLEEIKNAPGCFRSFASRILPSIASILEQPLHQPEGLIAGSFDLLSMLLKNAPTDVVNAVFDTCFISVIRIILQSNDHSEMQTGADCLSSIVSAGKQDLLAWSTEPQLTMKTLFDVASRLLDPDLESSGSFCVGTYIVQLILHFPSEIALHIRELLAALMRRMQSCEIASLKSSLIVVFARLFKEVPMKDDAELTYRHLRMNAPEVGPPVVAHLLNAVPNCAPFSIRSTISSQLDDMPILKIHSSVPNVEHLINMMLNLPANGHTNCFAYVMTEWTRQQGEIQGAYQIKVTTSALALLLSTKSAALANINVQGHPLKTNTGITTRSKSKVVPDQWSIVPLPVKLVSLLSDTLIEIQEQVLDDNNEDSECEEVYKQSSNDIHDNILFSSALLDSKLTDENLDAMAKVFDESVDNDDYGAGLLKADPLNEINLANYLGGFFANFSKTDNLTFSQLCQSLSQSQKTAIAKILDNQIPS